MPVLECSDPVSFPQDSGVFQIWPEHNRGWSVASVILLADVRLLGNPCTKRYTTDSWDIATLLDDIFPAPLPLRLLMVFLVQYHEKQFSPSVPSDSFRLAHNLLLMVILVQYTEKLNCHQTPSDSVRLLQTPSDSSTATSLRSPCDENPHTKL